MLSKSSLCVYTSDACVKILLGWITHQLPSEDMGGAPISSSPHSGHGRHSNVCLKDGFQNASKRESSFKVSVWPRPQDHRSVTGPEL